LLSSGFVVILLSLLLTLLEAIVRKDEQAMALLLSARASEFMSNFDASHLVSAHSLLFAGGQTATNPLKDLYALFQQKVSIC
jgi:hypothetical protein